MRAHVFSDVHFEHHRPTSGIDFWNKLYNLQKKDPAPLAILAGDICQVGHTGGLWKQSMAQLCSSYDKVIYVPGNHEYYGSSFDEVQEFFEDSKADPNLHNLVNLNDPGTPTFEYKGQRFIGGTMWFADKGYSSRYKSWMNDFSIIRKFEPEVYRLHEFFLRRLRQNLRKGDVVVTHHMPLPASVDAQYAGSPLNDFFMSDRTQDLEEPYLPKMWIHGHTHTSCNYGHLVGDSVMWVYCNPHGYPNEGANRDFWDKVAIDV